MQRAVATITLIASVGLLSTCAAPADPSASSVNRLANRSPVQAAGQASWWEGALLFPFGRSSLDDLSADDRQRLQQLAERIRTHAGPVQRITITGHSDRIGSADRKHHRSLARAESVAALFKAHGLDAASITVIARSDTDASATCASTLPAASLLQCLAADREVTVQALAQSNPPPQPQAKTARAPDILM